MTWYKRAAVPVILSMAVVGTAGVVHGLATDRWGPSERLQQSVAALDRVPAAFGDWLGEDLPYEPEDMARAGIRRCVFRKYRNALSGETVSALLVCGRGGPISVHTPDVCYGGAGYRQLGEASARQIPAGEATHAFRVARFAKPGGVAQAQLEVFWAWSPDGRGWSSPDAARFSFARSPALYKLYVVREFLPGSKAEATDACQRFLERALPDLTAGLTAEQ